MKIEQEVILLQHVEMFRTIYALCDLRKDKSLKVTHYTCVLEAGPNPIWGIFSARTNRLMSLLGPRSMIHEKYPEKVWKRRQATWTMGRVIAALDLEERHKILRKQLDDKKPIKPTESNVVDLKQIA